MLRLVLSAVGTQNEYTLFYEKDTDVERCFVVCWLDNTLRKICIRQEALDLLRKVIRLGFVAFPDLREVLTDLVDLWPSIRLFIRCTGLPHVKDQADSVSVVFFCQLFPHFGCFFFFWDCFRHSSTVV